MSEPIRSLPTTRPAGCPFDPPAELASAGPIRRMVYPDGHVGWLVTSHELSRAVLGDATRFSSRYELMHLPIPLPEGVDELPPAPPGDLTGIDPPEHTRYRQVLARYFTLRRMRLLTERAEEACAVSLDAMAALGSPADLVTAFAQPVPALMICELLGVPYEDHEMFQRHAVTLTSTSGPAEDKVDAMNALYAYLDELVATKRRSPADDLLSELTASDLTDVELAGTGAFLLGAGLDTTANMIALGTFALLTNQEQLDALRSGRCTPAEAVEELLRYLTIAHTNVRAALSDVELGGELIRAGETVTVSMQAANRDPARYPDPDRLDLSRDAASHIAMGYGVHQCLGQQLARVEMRAAFPALLERFPTLRLAVEPAKVPLRTESTIYGVRKLPVAWD